jgi:negative regulator of flagellin synthesis FlgM
MTINSINSIGSVNQVNQSGKTGEVQKLEKTDSISISAEAKQRADFLYAKGIVDAAPDLREDLVADLKVKINDPSYLNEKMLMAAADNIMAEFGL